MTGFEIKKPNAIVIEITEENWTKYNETRNFCDPIPIGYHAVYCDSCRMMRAWGNKKDSEQWAKWHNEGKSRLDNCKERQEFIMKKELNQGGKK